MNTLLSMFLFMMVFYFMPVATSFQENTNAYVSTKEGKWIDARSLCFGNDENNVLNGCQPDRCNPYSLNRTIRATGEDTVYWLQGYVIRSQIMEYYGCYQHRFNGTIKQTLNNTFENDSIIQCSNSCNGTDFDVILFTRTVCYCVRNKTYKEWKNITALIEISSDKCNLKCPGDQYNRCGSDKDPAVLSVYKLIPNYPDILFNTVGQVCFYVDANRAIKYTECSRLSKFKCQHIEISDAGGTWYNKCYNLSMNWYDARMTCEHEGKFLSTYNLPPCEIGKNRKNDETWHNRFVTEKITWNKDDPAGSCLALKVTKESEYKLVTRDCSEKHKTLCKKGPELTAKDTSDSNNKLTSSTVALYITSLLVFLLVALVVVSVIRRKVHRTNSTSYSDVTENKVLSDEVDYCNIDVVYPGHELSTVVNRDDLRAGVATSRNDILYSVYTDEVGYLNHYQPLKKNCQLSIHVYDSPSKPIDYENNISLLADNAPYEYESLNKSQPDDHVHE